MRDHTTYLILGAGAAGITAAEAIRQRDHDGRILMITEDQGLICKRPLLSKSPLTTLRGGNLSLHKEEWYEDHHIQQISRCKIMSLDTENHKVDTEHGQFTYEKCIYALGGHNYIPPFPGRELYGVMTVRSEEDVRRIKHIALDCRQAVIIGGGVIGLEMALELKRYGMQVTVLEACPRLMARQLDQRNADWLFAHLRDIRVETGVTIRSIRGTNRVEAVELADGSSFPCGLVLVSCGQKANLDIAREAGVACDRGVLVNDRMETDKLDLWACGDCAQWRGSNAALWSQALAQAAVAGANAAGDDRKLVGFDNTLVLNGEDISLCSMGDAGCDPNKAYKRVEKIRRFGNFSINERPKEAIEVRYYLSGRMVGGCILGNLSGMAAMAQELRKEGVK